MQTEMCPLIDGHKFQANEIRELNLGLPGLRSEKNVRNKKAKFSINFNWRAGFFKIRDLGDPDLAIYR